MSVRLDGEVIRLDGACRVEDAEPLAALLHDHPAAAVDLAACTALHAAVLQALLAHRPAVAGAPTEPFLARWIAPLLPSEGLAKTARP